MFYVVVKQLLTVDTVCIQDRLLCIFTTLNCTLLYHYLPQLPALGATLAQDREGLDTAHTHFLQVHSCS